MKRARKDTGDGPIYASTTARKSKSFQACASCRKNKTRCELLDTTTDPIRCHRCKTLGVSCSYEDTLLPSPDPIAEPPISCSWSKWRKPKPKEDLPFPGRVPANRLWDFVSTDHDWSAPMLAMHNLTRGSADGQQPPSTTESRPSEGPLALANVLSEEQIRILLSIFDQKFTPWLNFRLIYDGGTKLLDTVCCMIASRYLPELPKQQQAALAALTEDIVVQIIVKPRTSESLEAIQALLVLSLWEPVTGSVRADADGRDARVLVASAVSMGLNLRLNQASAKADSLRKAAEIAGGFASAEDMRFFEDTMDRARLWISVTNAESMLCLGSGRVPLSRRSAEDNRLVQFPDTLVGFNDHGSLRLGIVAMQSSVAEIGISLRMPSSDEANEWFDKMTNTLESLKRGRRFLLPLPVVLEQEQQYYHVLHLYDGICRLLVLYHGLWEARLSVGHVSPGESWHDHFRPRGINVVADWARDLTRTAEQIMVYALQSNVDVLGSAPDNYLVMVALAAGYCVGVKFLMSRVPGPAKRFIGASELLLSRIITHLEKAAPPIEAARGHMARRTAELIRRMVYRWENRHALGLVPPDPSMSSWTSAATSRQFSIPDLGPGAGVGYVMNATSAASVSSTRGNTPPSDHSRSQSTMSFDGCYYPQVPMQDQAWVNPAMAVPPELDFSLFLNSSIALDAQFWQEMQDNQNLSGGF
ncbi:hypothetical protein MKEN_00447700 [Mycena kentingensis (nom. inval.)]|nr:hypothetical protein MKEN_00447700 [Mycena kentingensis (nom. inval.)]